MEIRPAQLYEQREVSSFSPVDSVAHKYGSFTLLYIPSSVDLGQVSANYDNGVLKIKLAKKAEAKPQQIKVNVGSEKKTLEAKAA